MKMNKLQKILLAGTTALAVGTMFALTGDAYRKTSTSNVEPTSLEAIIVDVGTPLETTLEMRDFAVNAVTKSNAHTDYDKAKAVYNALDELHLQYDTDSTKRPIQVQTAKEIFQSRRGHCLEVSELYVALTRAVGVKSNFLAEVKNRHETTVFEFGDKYFNVDPTERCIYHGKKVDSSNKRDGFCSEITKNLPENDIGDERLFIQILFQDGYSFWVINKYQDAMSNFEKLQRLYPNQKVLDIKVILDSCRKEKEEYNELSNALTSDQTGLNLYNMGKFYARFINDEVITSKFKLQDCEKSLNYLESARKAGFASEEYMPLYERVTKEYNELKQERAKQDEN